MKHSILYHGFKKNLGRPLVLYLGRGYVFRSLSIQGLHVFALALCMQLIVMECNSKGNVETWKLRVHSCDGGFAREVSLERCK